MVVFHSNWDPLHQFGVGYAPLTLDVTLRRVTQSGVCLVTLRLESPRSHWDPVHACVGLMDLPESITPTTCRNLTACRPPGYLDLDYQRLRYYAYPISH